MLQFRTPVIISQSPRQRATYLKLPLSNRLPKFQASLPRIIAFWPKKEKPLSIETTSISIIPKFETLSGSESEDEDSFIIPRLEPLPQIITEMPTTPKYEHLSSSSDNDSSDDNSSSSGSSSGSSSSSDDSNSSSSDSE
ncbi:unnamed protein product [Lepeophtheirus salmonis]|uniref:(salmon louse) hypothetical protein n=1 Tax=Lepeophtheirus salmonis TaxID=72036 RepID=A0A7R8CTG1_LEPSM|nr:unnamed protein product [Lepeophtheirus salmonis]CAF2925917.1 unnamed protein product [Lepeophtheirus salmonis]